MDHAQWWLMVVAFVLGLALTFALMIRRVKREVSVSTSAGATSAGGAGKGASASSGAEYETPTTRITTGRDAPTTRIATGRDAATTKIPTAGKSASEYETTKIPTVTDAPHGPGSSRAGDNGSGPSGWLVKGKEDGKVYHTPDSPSYEQTVADVWFKTEQSAVQAGFSPWKKGK
jgi:uncharacterized membrane protein ArfC